MPELHTDRQWAEVTVAVYTALVAERIHFAQASYRDGQWHAILGKTSGTDINGDVYAPALGEALAHTLLHPVGQWCVFWWPHPKVGHGTRRRALEWIRQHRPNVRWIPDRPIGKALHYGLAAPFFRACRTRRVVLVGPAHMADLDLFPGFRHIVCPSSGSWQHVDRLAKEVLALHEPDDLVLLCAGHASNLLVHLLWPALGRKATLLDLGATLEPFVGRFSRGEFRTPGWAENVLPLNHPDHSAGGMA